MPERIYSLFINQAQYKCEFGAFFISRRYARAVYAIIMCPSVWCGCSVPAADWAEWLDSSAIVIAQLVHAASESISAVRGGDMALPKLLWDFLLLLWLFVCGCSWRWWDNSPHRWRHHERAGPHGRRQLVVWKSSRWKPRILSRQFRRL